MNSSFSQYQQSMQATRAQRVAAFANVKVITSPTKVVKPKKRSRSDSDEHNSCSDE
jgi:hypothetical protein